MSRGRNQLRKQSDGYLGGHRGGVRLREGGNCGSRPISVYFRLCAAGFFQRWGKSERTIDILAINGNFLSCSTMFKRRNTNQFLNRDPTL